MHWPGKKPANIEYMTSHLDLVPTLLPEVLGCENPTEDYSVGMSIWKEAGRRNMSRGPYSSSVKLVIYRSQNPRISAS